MADSFVCSDVLLSIGYVVGVLLCIGLHLKILEWRTKKKDGKKTLVDELCEKAEAKGVKLTEEEVKSLLHKLFFDYIDRLEPQKEKTEDEEESLPECLPLADKNAYGFIRLRSLLRFPNHPAS